jgi:hypothetical protein
MAYRIIRRKASFWPLLEQERISSKLKSAVVGRCNAPGGGLLRYYHRSESGFTIKG